MHRAHQGAGSGVHLDAGLQQQPLHPVDRLGHLAVDEPHDRTAVVVLRSATSGSALARRSARSFFGAPDRPEPWRFHPFSAACQNRVPIVTERPLREARPLPAR